MSIGKRIEWQGLKPSDVIAFKGKVSFYNLVMSSTMNVTISSVRNLGM